VVVDAVVFDVGEMLVNETREYETWADWLSVPRHTYSAVFSAGIVLGMDYRDTFQYFRPGFSLDSERARRADAGRPEWPCRIERRPWRGETEFSDGPLKERLDGRLVVRMRPWQRVGFPAAYGAGRDRDAKPHRVSGAGDRVRELLL
jgi:hypothetical protein